MASANDLYKMEPVHCSFDINEICGYGKEFLIEATGNYYSGLTQTENKIEIRFLKDWDFDGRRVWQLATIWFNSKPVMIIQCAGREGDDHKKRFITDAKVFREMCAYVYSLVLEQDFPKDDFFDPDTSFDELTNFYGYSLTGAFEKWFY